MVKTATVALEDHPGLHLVAKTIKYRRANVVDGNLYLNSIQSSQ